MIAAVTGANGFIGGYVVHALIQAGHTVRALVRHGVECDIPVTRIQSLNASSDITELTDALQEVDAVVHLAARVHVMNGHEDEDGFFDVNVGGTCRLFEAAAAAGVKRFIFVSSVKAAAERSGDGPVTADDTAQPEDAYGRSKRAAEQELLARSKLDGAPDVVILRPTFVYGWPPTGNFATLVSAVRRGIPLPFAGIGNRRDMLYVGNLADAVRAACTSTAVGAGPYFICDGAPVSTTALFRETAKAFGAQARLFWMPEWSLRLLAVLTGKRAAMDRLLEDFRVDGAPFRRDADWQPPYKMAEGLARCSAAASAMNKTEDAETP